ncbi:MAG: hypothetical protein WC707_07045 [Candidatus Babeliaceae bacterium]|jgi:hypothetical protein
MKTFNEWFEEKYGKVDNIMSFTKLIAYEIWQSAQEVQRDSDANIAWCFDNDLIADKIRNNKNKAV